MDRTRDLAQGLSRVENKLSNQEFVVLTLQPTVTAETFAANDVWFASTELPKAVVAGRGALIKSITVIDDDAQSIVGSSEDNTHAENQTILGEVEIPAASYVALATSTIATVTGIDLVVQPANNETSLYIFGHTDGTPSYTAAALTIRIGLQRL